MLQGCRASFNEDVHKNLSHVWFSLAARTAAAPEGLKRGWLWAWGPKRYGGEHCCHSTVRRGRVRIHGGPPGSCPFPSPVTVCRLPSSSDGGRGWSLCFAPNGRGSSMVLWLRGCRVSRTYGLLSRGESEELGRCSWGASLRGSRLLSQQRPGQGTDFLPLVP